MLSNAMHCAVICGQLKQLNALVLILQRPPSIEIGTKFLNRYTLGSIVMYIVRACAFGVFRALKILDGYVQSV